MYIYIICNVCILYNYTYVGQAYYILSYTILAIIVYFIAPLSYKMMNHV